MYLSSTPLKFWLLVVCSLSIIAVFVPMPSSAQETDEPALTDAEVVDAELTEAEDALDDELDDDLFGESVCAPMTR